MLLGLDLGTTNVKALVTDSNGRRLSAASRPVQLVHVGNGGVVALTNGNYVVRSPNWDNGAVINAGAATWRSGTSGVSGVVSAGFRTTVFPQAKAGATFQATIKSGKFQGMICPATPRGSRSARRSWIRTRSGSACSIRSASPRNLLTDLPICHLGLARGCASAIHSPKSKRS